MEEGPLSALVQAHDIPGSKRDCEDEPPMRRRKRRKTAKQQEVEDREKAKQRLQEAGMTFNKHFQGQHAKNKESYAGHWGVFLLAVGRKQPLRRRSCRQLREMLDAQTSSTPTPQPLALQLENQEPSVGRGRPRKGQQPELLADKLQKERPGIYHEGKRHNRAVQEMTLSPVTVEVCQGLRIGPWSMPGLHKHERSFQTWLAAGMLRFSDSDQLGEVTLRRTATRSF